MIENLNFSLAFFHIPVETPFIGYFTPRAHFSGQQTKETKDYLRKFIPLLGHASSPSLAILCSRQLFSTRRACTHALECRSHWTRNRLWTRLEDRESSGDNRPDALSARVLSRCNGVKDPRRGRFGSSKFQVHVPRLPPRSTTTTAIVAAITDPTTTTIAGMEDERRRRRGEYSRREISPMRSVKLPLRSGKTIFTLPLPQGSIRASFRSTRPAVFLIRSTNSPRGCAPFQRKRERARDQEIYRSKSSRIEFSRARSCLFYNFIQF